ncbi:hypothetical protein ATK36_5464 [Amycolatopsis sulphurea]|uniref:Uncharacterized protein n=1 Tax=Amycolatopsis sulphurea TaxID=76022 RepID=A0A2A9FIB6_9PSEU|nr:hypothetical protein ATK36_5464 [Amycolatopsis sulphurea]
MPRARSRRQSRKHRPAEHWGHLHPGQQGVPAVAGQGEQHDHRHGHRPVLPAAHRGHSAARPCAAAAGCEGPLHGPETGRAATALSADHGPSTNFAGAVVNTATARMLTDHSAKAATATDPVAPQRHQQRERTRPGQHQRDVPQPGAGVQAYSLTIDVTGLSRPPQAGTRRRGTSNCERELRGPPEHPAHPVGPRTGRRRRRRDGRGTPGPARPVRPPGNHGAVLTLGGDRGYAADHN